MFQHIIVPVDGSDRSWVAARLGGVIARSCAADLELVHVVPNEDLCASARQELGRVLEEVGPLAVDAPIVTLVPADDSDGSDGSTIATYAEAVEGSMIVMSSTGRGRSAAVLGSVTDDVLRSMFGPIIVVGPRVSDVESFGGDIAVTVDGSAFSETILPMAAAWGIGLGATPWIVEVLTEPVSSSDDLMESSYAHRLANDLQAKSHHDVQFEVLRGGSAAHAIVEFAAGPGVGLIMMATHGRSGLRRLTTGSTASSVVHHSTVPVVLSRPPRLALD